MPTTPDILIVLDRSGSMQRDGRWQPSVSAVRTITTDLQAQINFGLALFPKQVVIPDLAACLNLPQAEQAACFDAAAQSLGDAVACGPGNIVVPVAPNNGAMIGTTLDTTTSEGGTPTGETLRNLIGTFGAPPADPDKIQAPRFVLLVTDGQPTCPNGNGEDTTPADIEIANTAIDSLRDLGVRTYVVGYNTTGPANSALATVLDGFATRGGTGDMMHRPVENEQGLRDELQRIAGDVISCTFVLDKAPPRADYVLVRVDGKQINLADPNGWQLVGDRTVELTGSTCETLKADGAHVVDAEVRCQVVTPI
ncbi:MAG TPA: vWA domain-containing protein, partial [Polyangiales bacterium]|nr:vWA domain-containing protein [Polyangiales bacterium]